MPISMKDFDSGIAPERAGKGTGKNDIVELMEADKAYTTKELKEKVGKSHQATLNRLKRAVKAGLVRTNKINGVSYWALGKQEGEVEESKG